MHNNVKTTFENLNNATTDQEKVDVLSKGISPGLILILKGMFRTDFVFDVVIPEYTKRDPRDTGMQSLEEAALILPFLSTTSSMTAEAKTKLLKETLERMNNSDSDLLLAAINKNLPILTREIVGQAFPGLLD